MQCGGTLGVDLAPQPPGVNDLPGAMGAMKGVGKTVAHELFDRFPGAWQVRQMHGNTPAQAFWRSVVSDYTSNQFEESTRRIEEYDTEMTVQTFVSPKQ